MKFTIEIDENDIAVLSATLNEHPYKLVAPLIAKLDAQIKTQQKPRAVPGMPDGVAQDESGSVVATAR
jgi:hypothetical protein